MSKDAEAAVKALLPVVRTQWQMLQKMAHAIRDSGTTLHKYATSIDNMNESAQAMLDSFSQFEQHMDEEKKHERSE